MGRGRRREGWEESENKTSEGRGAHIGPHTGPSSLAGLDVEIYLPQLASDETQNSGPELGHIPVRPGLKTLPRHPQKP